MSKARIFHVAGLTNPLVDGEKRHVVLVALLTSKPVVREQLSESQQRKNTENSVTIIDTKVSTYRRATEYTLSFGLSVVAPCDTKEMDLDKGMQIAIGKAAKDKSALLVTKTDHRFFTRTVIEAMLNAKLKHIIEDPDSFIKVSARSLHPALLD